VLHVLPISSSLVWWKWVILINTHTNSILTSGWNARWRTRYFETKFAQKIYWCEQQITKWLAVRGSKWIMVTAGNIHTTFNCCGEGEDETWESNLIHGTRSIRVVSSRSGHFTLEEKAPGVHWTEGWADFIAGLDAVTKEDNAHLYQTQMSVIQPVANQCTVWAIPIQELGKGGK
jgi:hypothetical protein